MTLKEAMIYRGENESTLALMLATRPLDVRRWCKPGGLEKLSQGVELARDKGLDDALILMDGSAFIVSAKNSTVITALNGRELNGKVITNIDGTVIL